MSYLVPFDGSPLSKAALVRASVYAVAINRAPPGIRRELGRSEPVDVMAVTAIPDSPRYAREKGWIDENEAFSVGTVMERLRKMVEYIAPGASFEFERVDPAATAGTISQRLRRRAIAAEVSVVFIGSENAGRIITPITSVAGGITSAQDYDVHVVRRAIPPDDRERLKSALS